MTSALLVPAVFAHCRNAWLTPTLDTSGAIERGCRALGDAIF